ncbi:MAG: transcriptional regulator GutM [Micropruina sp.]
MDFWFLLIILGVSYLAQVGFSFFQLQDFSRTYGVLRRQGKVAIGKRKNAFSAGSIALLLIDDEGTIREARALSGITVWARFKPIQGFDGVAIENVTQGPLAGLPRGLRQAMLNARDNWLTVQLGHIPEDPPGPLTRILARVRRMKGNLSRAHHAPRVVRT